MKNEYRHIPVMKHQVVDLFLGKNVLKNKKNNIQLNEPLAPQPDAKNPLNGKVFVDCTLGGAGHSVEIAKYLGKDGLLIGIDQDASAIEAAGFRLNNIPEEQKPQISLVKDNFGHLDKILLDQKIPGVDYFLMDLGVSSTQIDVISRGFSFKEDCPLDMRMDPNKQTLNAAKVVNSYGKDNLIRVLRDFSDEKFSYEIASKIIEARKDHYIDSSWELVEIIKDAIPAPARRKGGHPAKRTFQALRIEVNGELAVLKQGLDSAVSWLNPGGRIVVMSYHSLEDRIVKDTFSGCVNRCTCPPDLPQCVCGKKPVLKVITKKPLTASAEEVEFNTRSRSAKVRCAEKL